jgi:hypothetical protein
MHESKLTNNFINLNQNQVKDLHHQHQLDIKKLQHQLEIKDLQLQVKDYEIKELKR